MRILNTSQVQEELHRAVASAPPVVRSCAEEFINSLSDFYGEHIPVDELNEVWNSDLPEEYRAKYDFEEHEENIGGDR